MTSICSSCKQSKSNECFSKKQFKRSQSEPEYAIKCIDCLKEIETKLKQQNKQKQGKQQQQLKPSDPSQLYFLSPLNAPILKDFQKFFAKEYSFQNPPPAIHLGRKTKWRTSVKLAVRGEIGIDRKVTTHIGLFHPGSHTVVDCMNSVAHHGRINEAVKFIHSVMTTLQINGSIEGLDSEDKKIHKYHAYIRYLLLSLERKSGLIQLSIVWNASNKILLQHLSFKSLLIN